MFACFQNISCHFAVRGHISLSLEKHASMYSSPLMTDAASTIAATCSVEHQYVFSKKLSQEMLGFSANETLCAISKTLHALGHVVIEKNDGPPIV